MAGATFMPGTDTLSRAACVVAALFAILTSRPSHSQTPDSALATTETSQTGTASEASPTSVRLASAKPDANPGTDATTSQPDDSSLQQVVITAQYRKERLVETPLSVSVLSGKYLDSLAAIHLSDW